MKLAAIEESRHDYLTWLESGDSTFKWTAVRQWQKEWSPGAPDFGAMIQRAIYPQFISTFWPDRPKFIGKALKVMSENDPQKLKQAFLDLFYPRVLLTSRIEHFQVELEHIFKPLYNQVGLGVKDHGHKDVETVFMYLHFNKPEHLPLYDPDQIQKYASLVQLRNIPGPRDWEEVIKVHKVLHTLLKRDEKWMADIGEIIGSDFSPDHLTLSQDYMAFMTR